MPKPLANLDGGTKAVGAWQAALKAAAVCLSHNFIILSTRVGIRVHPYILIRVILPLLPRSSNPSLPNGAALRGVECITYLPQRVYFGKREVD